MQTIRAAAVSMNAPFDRLNQILVDVEGWCRRCADAGAELVLFPELLVHGYCTPNWFAIRSRRSLVNVAASLHEAEL